MAATPPPPATARVGPVRLVGVGLGVAVGIAVLVLVLGAGLVFGLASGATFALLVGPDGILSPDRGAPYVWVVPPIAAAVAGGLVAPWAVRRRRWAGMTMGYVTYLIAILIGPLFVLILPGLGAGPTVGLSAASPLDSLLGVVFGVGLLWFIGAVILAPVLVVFVLGGVAWAIGVRRVVGASPGNAPSGRDDDPAIDAALVAMVVVAGVLGVLWVVLTTVLQILVGAPGG